MLNPGCRETRYWPAGEHARYLPPAARRCELHLPELPSTPAILEGSNVLRWGRSEQRRYEMSGCARKQHLGSLFIQGLHSHTDATCHCLFKGNSTFFSFCFSVYFLEFLSKQKNYINKPSNGIATLLNHTMY
jgi:hypothetical protein